MARSTMAVTIQRQLEHPPSVVFELVSDAGRQEEWMPGQRWTSCKVRHASGPLRGPSAVHIRVLEDDAAKQDVTRLETREFEDEDVVLFSDGRYFEVDEASGGGTLLTYGHEQQISTGLSRRVRKALGSEGDLLPESVLEAEMDRICALLAADADRAAAEDAG